jgi:hypothetical protein
MTSIIDNLIKKLKIIQCIHPNDKLKFRTNQDVEIMHDTYYNRFIRGRTGENYNETIQFLDTLCSNIIDMTDEIVSSKYMDMPNGYVKRKLLISKGHIDRYQQLSMIIREYRSSETLAGIDEIKRTYAHNANIITSVRHFQTKLDNHMNYLSTVINIVNELYKEHNIEFSSPYNVDVVEDEDEDEVDVETVEVDVKPMDEVDESQEIQIDNEDEDVDITSVDSDLKKSNF